MVLAKFGWGQNTAKSLPSHAYGQIVVFLDRAPWHRGQEIAKVLRDKPRLGLIFFPTASPELNPQERVWKATRQAIRHNHEYASLPALAGMFEDFLRKITFPVPSLTTLVIPLFVQCLFSLSIRRLRALDHDFFSKLFARLAFDHPGFGLISLLQKVLRLDQHDLSWTKSHAEKGNDLLVARRQKNQGMHWSENTSNSLATLQTLLLNRGWDVYWQKRQVLTLAPGTLTR